MPRHRDDDDDGWEKREKLLGGGWSTGRGQSDQPQHERQIPHVNAKHPTYDDRNYEYPLKWSFGL